MINHEPAIVSLLESHSHCVASLWTIQPLIGSAYRYTDYQKPITYNGFIYNPVMFMSGSAINRPQGLKERNRSFLGQISTLEINDDDLRSGIFNGAEVTETVVNYRFPWAGSIRENTYFITEITWTGEHWEAELNGLTTKLRQAVGSTIGRRCRFVLGDSNCGVDIESYSVNDSVDSVTTQRNSFICSNLIDNGLDRYTNGYVLWTSGNNSGFSTEISSFNNSTGQISFSFPTSFNIEVSDEFTVYPGCSKTKNDCQGTSGTSSKPWDSNYENFGGFPHVPGNLAALNTPDSL